MPGSRGSALTQHSTWCARKIPHPFVAPLTAGEKDRALDCLDKAKNSGMVSAGWLKNDSDLVSLHELPRFQKILEEMAR